MHSSQQNLVFTRCLGVFLEYDLANDPVIVITTIERAKQVRLAKRTGKAMLLRNFLSSLFTFRWAALAGRASVTGTLPGQ